MKVPVRSDDMRFALPFAQLQSAIVAHLLKGQNEVPISTDQKTNKSGSWTTGMIILLCYAYVYSRLYVCVCKGEPDEKIHIRFAIWQPGIFNPLGYFGLPVPLSCLLYLLLSKY